MLLASSVAFVVVAAVVREERAACDLYGDPSRGLQRLVDTAPAGATACLSAGTYDETVEIRRGPFTIRAAPGARAVIRGSLWIRANGVTVSRVVVDGSWAPPYRPEWADAEGYPADYRETRPALLVNGDDVRVELSEITNRRGICVLLGDAGGRFGVAESTVLDANRIHHCGRLAPSGQHTNRDHGIYVEAARDARITNNLVYASRDRGIQLFPDARRTLVENNVIDGNGVAILFGGSDEALSEGNVVRRNIVSNSTLANGVGRRYSVDGRWDGAVGTGNVFEDNCVWQPGEDGEVWVIQRPPIGFAVPGGGNRFVDPRFSDRERGDFTVRSPVCAPRAPREPVPPLAGANGRAAPASRR